VGIYLDTAPNATVRWNIVLGTSNAEFWRDGQTVGAGIALNNETYHYQSTGSPLSLNVQTRGAKIYGNLVAFASSGVAFWGQLDESAFNNTIVSNNTLVDNDTQLTLGRKSKPGSKLVNNIVLSLSPGTRDVDNSDLGGMIADHNYLSEGNPGGDFSGGTNLYDGLTLTRMAGWRTIDSASAVGWRDFAMTAGSSAIGAGDGEPGQMSQDDNTFNLDFNGLLHNTPLDLGALAFSEDAVRIPKTPTDFHGTPH
jgi:hypothetical protein